MRINVDNVRIFLINLLNKNKRVYGVSGCIEIKLCRSSSPDLNPAIFTEAIQEIDRLYPWRDTKLSIEEARHVESIKSLGNPYKKDESLFLFTGAAWRIDICPGRHDMTRSQVYAYKNYLANIARRLSLKRFPDVLYVESTINITSSDIFN